LGKDAFFAEISCYDGQVKESGYYI